MGNIGLIKYSKDVKRILVVWILLCTSFGLSVPASYGAGNCGAGGVLPSSFDYMNAPADPTSVAAFAGTKKLGELRVNNSTTMASFFVSPFVGDGLQAGEVETYFFYWSSDGGKNWSCSPAYASGTSVSVQPNLDYVAIVVAQARTGKGISTITKFSTKKVEKQICASGKVSLTANYDSLLKEYDLKLSFNNLNSEEKSLQYLLEVSTDNWKTKAVFKNLISLYNPTKSIKPIKEGVAHQFKLSPDASTIYIDPNGLVSKYTTVGCNPLTANASTSDNRTECEKNPGLDKCQYTVVPGDNSQVSPTTPSIASAAPQKITITCIKGKLSKKVTAIKPTCPAGYSKR
jgi:hypothetical protein